MLISQRGYIIIVLQFDPSYSAEVTVQRKYQTMFIQKAELVSASYLCVVSNVLPLACWSWTAQKDRENNKNKHFKM